MRGSSPVQGDECTIAVRGLESFSRDLVLRLMLARLSETSLTVMAGRRQGITVHVLPIDVCWRREDATHDHGQGRQSITVTAL